MTDRKLRVFLCHASQDKPLVRELRLRFADVGWIDPWLDEKKLHPGEDWRVSIEEAVESSDLVLICLSNNSVNKEGFVQKELRYAREIALEKTEGTIFLIPLRLEECDVPRGLRFFQWADYFGGDKEQNYEDLLESFSIRRQQILRREAESARKEAEERERREIEENARKQTDERVRREAEEMSRREAEQKVRIDAEERARKDAEQKATILTEELARMKEVEKLKKEVGGKKQRKPEMVIQDVPKKASRHRTDNNSVQEILKENELGDTLSNTPKRKIELSPDDDFQKDNKFWLGLLIIIMVIYLACVLYVIFY